MKNSIANKFMSDTFDFFNLDSYNAIDKDNNSNNHLEGNGEYVLSSTCSKKLPKQRFEHGCVNNMETPHIQHALCMEEWSSAYDEHNDDKQQKISPYEKNKPPLYDLLSVLSAARSTYGSPYDMSAFGHGDKLFLEFILQRHLNIKNICEFGTFTGITSLYFGTAAALRNGSFVTFDIADQRTKEVKEIWLSNMQFQLADLENPNNIAMNVIPVLQKTDLLFNDGWQKDVESQLYAKYLPIGAGVFQHDFSYNHIRHQSGYDVLENLGFTPLYEDVAKYFNSCGRFWIKTSSSIITEGDDDDHVSSNIMMNPVSSEKNKPTNDDESDFMAFIMQFPEGKKLLSLWHESKKLV